MRKSPEKVWILTGNEENWDRAVSDKIWGVREGNQKKQWEKVQKGDLLFFYAKVPVSGLIGLGITESKFKQNKPLWPEEIREKKVIYPYRFEFEIIYYLPSSWQEKKIEVADLRLPFQSGLNLLSRKGAIEEVLRRMKEQWNVDLPDFDIKKVEEAKKEPAESPSLHNQIRDMLYEIGVLEGFISEKEYPIDGERLDVAWRRVARGVPTKVFEVQVGGSIHQALSKLKHSFDLWNSELFLIIDPKHKQKTDELLSGTFHEIADAIRVSTIDEVQELYEQLISSRELKERLGL